MHIHTHRFWRSAARWLLGSTAVLLLTFVCFHFPLDPTTVALLYLILIAVVALTGAIGPTILASLVGVLCFDFFFTVPLFQIRLTLTLDIVAVIAFTGTAFVVSSLASTRKRDNAALREQASLLDLTHDVIFVRDMDNVINYWNRGAADRYGWTREEAVGKVSHRLAKTIFPAPLEAIDAELRRAGHWEGELIHTKRDGTQIVVASRWALQRDKSGNPLAILETNNDITERKRAEDALRQLNDQLEQRVMDRTTELESINRELEAFTHSVSHDLRAPLRHMVGYTELLQKNASSLLDAKSSQYTMTILDSAKRMGNLIDDLLAFSRVGRTEMQKTTVSLEQLVKEARSEVGPEAAGRDIAWTIGPLPAVYGDRSMLRLALVNLISNAVKFTRTRSQAQVEIGCTDGKADATVVFVRDNGVGFDMKYANKLFGVFQRLHRAEEFEGTGIGLANVQRIIHRHGGGVWAEGRVDGGATFSFSVPKS